MSLKSCRPTISSGLLSCLLTLLSTTNPAFGDSIKAVDGLGTTYVDENTTGGPWALLGYGANGKLGSLLTTAGGSFDAARQGSATLNALAFAKQSQKLAISWNQTGKPNGGITSYQHAVSFTFPNPIVE